MPQAKVQPARKITAGVDQLSPTGATLKTANNTHFNRNTAWLRFQHDDATTTRHSPGHRQDTLPGVNKHRVRGTATFVLRYFTSFGPGCPLFLTNNIKEFRIYSQITTNMGISLRTVERWDLPHFEIESHPVSSPDSPASSKRPALWKRHPAARK